MNSPKTRLRTVADRPRIVEIDLHDLHPNPDQPRKTFSEESLIELAASIERHGLIQPITVKRLDSGTYLLVAGERRFRAFERLGRPTIPAIVTTGDAEEIALIENIQREDLNPLEVAEALARMMDRHRYTQEQLGQVVGKSQAAVSQVLGLLNLPETIKTEYRAAPRSSKSLLVEIAAMKSEAEQLRLWAAIKDGRIANVKAARAERAAQQRGDSPPASTQEVIKACKPLIRALERLDAPTAIRITTDDYNALVALCERLNAIVAGMTPESPDVETDDTDYES
jgi:ParB family chromosome partitioning protein